MGEPWRDKNHGAAASKPFAMVLENLSNGVGANSCRVNVKEVVLMSTRVKGPMSKCNAWVDKPPPTDDASDYRENEDDE